MTRWMAWTFIILAFNIFPVFAQNELAVFKLPAYFVDRLEVKQSNNELWKHLFVDFSKSLQQETLPLDQVSERLTLLRKNLEQLVQEQYYLKAVAVAQEGLHLSLTKGYVDSQLFQVFFLDQLDQMAASLWSANHYNDAADVLYLMLQTYSTLGYTREVYDCLVRLAEMSTLALNDYQAIDFYRFAVFYTYSQNDYEMFMQSLIQLAKVSLSAQKVSELKDVAQTGLSVVYPRDDIHRGIFLLYLARAQKALGELEALAQTLKQMDLYIQEYGFKRLERMYWQDWGILYLDLKHYEWAYSIFEFLLKPVSENAAPDAIGVEACAQMARLYGLRGDFKQMDTFFKRALALQLSVNDDREDVLYLDIQSRYAFCMAFMAGDYEGAAALYCSIMDFAQTPDRRSLWLSSAVSLAKIYKEQNLVELLAALKKSIYQKCSTGEEFVNVILIEGQVHVVPCALGKLPLWSVRALNQTETSYVFGTFDYGLGAGASVFPADLIQALKESDLYLSEYRLDTWKEQTSLATFSDLDIEVQELIRLHLRDLGVIDFDEQSCSLPELTLRLGQAWMRKEAASPGFDVASVRIVDKPFWSTDEVLQFVVKQTDKPSLFLIDQLADAKPLLQVISQRYSSTWISCLMGDWVDYLMSAYYAQLDLYKRGEYEELRLSLAEENPSIDLELWLPVLEDAFSSHRAFVALNISHVLGPEGILQKLEDLNYEVKLVEPTFVLLDALEIDWKPEELMLKDLLKKGE